MLKIEAQALKLAEQVLWPLLHFLFLPHVLRQGLSVNLLDWLASNTHLTAHLPLGFVYLQLILRADLSLRWIAQSLWKPYHIEMGPLRYREKGVERQ